MPEAEVDMLRAARDAQFEPLSFLGAGFKKVLAPAKVNLFLGIGARRSDGYHELSTVMHALALHDVLYVNATPRPKGEEDAHLACAGPTQSISVSISIADKTARFGEEPFDVPIEQNLCFKAVDLLARVLGRTQDEHVAIHIEKSIPAQAGLGGGSSNAAAVLVALAGFWGLPASGQTLDEVAAMLGADVAFFLQGGCALLDGVGERLRHALVPGKRSLVVVKPPVGVSTAAAYAAFDAEPAPIPAELLAQAEDATDASDVPLFNNLAKASESIVPELSAVGEWLANQSGIIGPDEVLLCGSGAATFAFAEGFDAASRIAGHAKQRGWWARPTALSSLRAAVVG